MIKKIESIKNLKVYPNILFSNRGTTAIVYRINANEVIKLYTNSLRRDILFRTRDMNSLLEKLSKINLNSFVSPKDIYVDEANNILGYSMDYVRGSYTNRLDLDIYLDDLIEAIKKLDQDNRCISMENYSILDLHERNMKFDGEYFKIFDLDGGIFKLNDTSKDIYEANSQIIKKVIVKGIYGVNSLKELNSNSLDFMDCYYNGTLLEMFEYIKKSTNSRCPTVNDARKVLRRNCVTYDNYYRMF